LELDYGVEEDESCEEAGMDEGEIDSVRGGGGVSELWKKGGRGGGCEGEGRGVMREGFLTVDYRPCCGRCQ